MGESGQRPYISAKLQHLQHYSFPILPVKSWKLHNLTHKDSCISTDWNQREARKKREKKKANIHIWNEKKPFHGISDRFFCATLCLLRWKCFRCARWSIQLLFRQSSFDVTFDKFFFLIKCFFCISVHYKQLDFDETNRKRANENDTQDTGPSSRLPTHLLSQSHFSFIHSLTYCDCEFAYICHDFHPERDVLINQAS